MISKIAIKEGTQNEYIMALLEKVQELIDAVNSLEETTKDVRLMK